MSHSTSGSNTWHETALILTDGERLASSSLFNVEDGGPLGVLMDRTRYNKTRLDSGIIQHLAAVHEGWLNISLASPVCSGSRRYRFVTGSLESSSPNTNLAAMGWLQSSSVGTVNIGQQVQAAPDKMMWQVSGLPTSGSITALKVNANGGDLHLKTVARAYVPTYMPSFELVRHEWSTALGAMSATLLLSENDPYGTLVSEYSASHSMTFNLDQPSLLSNDRAYYLRFQGEWGSFSKEGAYLLQAAFVHVTSSISGAS